MTSRGAPCGSVSARADTSGERSNSCAPDHREACRWQSPPGRAERLRRGARTHMNSPSPRRPSAVTCPEDTRHLGGRQRAPEMASARTSAALSVSRVPDTRAMTERDVRVEGVRAEARAEARPGTPEVTLLLTGLRLTLLGVLLSVGLGVAGVALSAGQSWWAVVVSSFGSVMVAAALLHARRSRRLLAVVAEWVLPGSDSG